MVRSYLTRRGVVATGELSLIKGNEICEEHIIICSKSLFKG